MRSAICSASGPGTDTNERRRSSLRPKPPSASWSRTAPTAPRSRRGGSPRPIIAARSTSPATRRAITTCSTSPGRTSSREIAQSFADAGAEILATNTLQRQPDQPGRLRRRASGPRDQRRRRADHPRGRRCATRRTAALGRRRARADQQDPVALARRQRSRLSRGRFRHSVATSMSSRSRRWSKAASISC